MPQTDALKQARWKHVSKNPEFEDMCDPFMTGRRRFKVEFNRYLSNVNLNFMPPMPKPIINNTINSKNNNLNYTSSNYSNLMKISNKSFCNNYTESNYINVGNNKNNNNNKNKNDFNQRQQQATDNYTNQNLMTRSTEFY